MSVETILKDLAATLRTRLNSINEKLVAKGSTEAVDFNDIPSKIEAITAGGSGDYKLSKYIINVDESSYVDSHVADGDIQTITIPNVPKEPTFVSFIRVYDEYSQLIFSDRRCILAIAYNKNDTQKVNYVISYRNSTDAYTTTGYTSNQDDSLVRVKYDEANQQLNIEVTYPRTIYKGPYYCYVLTESSIEEFEQSLLGGAS